MPPFGDNSQGLGLYWALAEGGELCSELDKKESQFFQAARRRGLLQMWRVAYCMYFGLDPNNTYDLSTQRVAFTGEQGAFIRFRIGEVRSFIKQSNNIALGERPSFVCLASNSDFTSQAQVEISDTIVDYLYKRFAGEQREREAVEAEGVFGRAFGWIRWDHQGGDMVTVDKPIPGVANPDGSPATAPAKVRSGAPKLDVLYPWEVVEEPFSRDPMWKMVRERGSKWELVAAYPDLAQRILDVSPKDAYELSSILGFDRYAMCEDDTIIRHFYHRRCAALPQGRYVGICGDVILWDEPCPTEDGLPIRDICSGKFTATQFGYADSWDLCAIQEMEDQLTSDTASNLSTFGRMSIVMEKGTDISVDAIARGQSGLTVPPGAKYPEALIPASMPPAVQWFLGFLGEKKMSVSGQNATSRGNPDPNASGQAQALQHSIAIEFQSGRQASLDAYREGIANLTLEMVRLNAEAPFVVEISGIEQRPYMQEFTRDDLSGIKRVMVQTANPMLRSQAGRLQLFEQLNQVEDPDERSAAMELIVTGQSTEFTRKDRTCDMRIRWENEQLAAGKAVSVLATDNPYKHVQSHVAEIEARSAQMQQNPQSLKAYLDHIAEHIRVYPTMDPNLANFLKIPPPPPMPGTPSGVLAGMTANAGQPASVQTSAAGSAQPTAAPGSPGAQTGANLPVNAPQPTDPSGIQLPSPSKPPKGSQAQAAAQ